jgi:hypothetical protein
MKKIQIVIVILVLVQITQSCKESRPDNSNVIKSPSAYDMRNDLSPKRLTIAMWDFSWLFMHYPGGAFEDFDKVTDELLVRGFNTIRIDAFPLIIGKLDSLNQVITIPGNPLFNWGPSDTDRLHTPVQELISFMEITKSKNINVILSTWGTGCSDFPDILKGYTDKKVFWGAWEKTLDILKEKDLLSHVVYVDFDQEFPFFSPFQFEINRLGTIQKENKTSSARAMEEAGETRPGYNKLAWNPSQMEFVRDLMSSTLTHFQKKYPGLRFTFSLTAFWEEVRALKLNLFDVLELHIWMSSSPRFGSRSQFDATVKDRGVHDYTDYMDRINQTMKSVRPMLLKDMHNRLSFAKEWSEEIGAPLVTTESWGPWWHMDHKDLDWKWLYDWCEQCMGLASDYGLWGATPWNYSHPYWANWKNIEWYKKVNSGFQDGKE